MNHKFEASQLDAGRCKICKRSAIDHTVFAQCESCENKGMCNEVNNILMCAKCEDRELNPPTQDEQKFLEALDDAIVVNDNHILPAEVPSDAVRHSSPVGMEKEVSPAEYMSKFAQSIMAELPANGSEFYNAKITALAELEAKINADNNIPKEKKAFFFAQQVQARQLKLFQVLVQTREIVTEIEAERYANFKAINQLAIRLSKEEREKLNIKYAEYNVPAAPKRVKAPRMTAEDKLIEGFAKLMFAPKKDGIVQWEALEASERQKCMEQAKQYYKMISGAKK